MPQQKYLDNNPISVYLIDNFFNALRTLLNTAMSNSDQCHTYLEIGCGEGEIFRRLEKDIKGNFQAILGCDIDTEALAYAKTMVNWATFRQISIYDIPTHFDYVDTLVCCEVLEHLQRPDTALNMLAEICRGYVIISVPREPLWRILNIARGKYWAHLGNTPGHLNHWNNNSLRKLLNDKFDIIETLRPLPWLMYLLKPKKAERF